MHAGNVSIFVHEPPMPLDPAPFAQARHKIVLYNTEQASRTETKRRLHDFVAVFPAMQYVDYSMSNIRLSALAGNWLPCSPSEHLLFSLASKADIAYDVVFMGGLSSRRAAIVANLERQGLKIATLERVYDGQQRNAILSLAHVLLNIHADSDYRVFEVFRCNSVLFSGMTVVSEDSEMDSITYHPDHLVLAPYEDLVNATVHSVQRCKLLPLGRCNAAKTGQRDYRMHRDLWRRKLHRILSPSS